MSTALFFGAVFVYGCILFAAFAVSVKGKF